jgi:hypothetical protein
LLSYFNQPDHELINRQDERVLNFLLRLSYSEADDAMSRETEAPQPLDGCPPADIEPLVVDGVSISWVWRSVRVAAMEEHAAAYDLIGALKSKGVRLIIIPQDSRAKGVALDELRAALSGARP